MRTLETLVRMYEAADDKARFVELLSVDEWLAMRDYLKARKSRQDRFG